MKILKIFLHFIHRGNWKNRYRNTTNPNCDITPASPRCCKPLRLPGGVKSISRGTHRETFPVMKSQYWFICALLSVIPGKKTKNMVKSRFLFLKHAVQKSHAAYTLLPFLSFHVTKKFIFHSVPSLVSHHLQMSPIIPSHSNHGRIWTERWSLLRGPPHQPRAIISVGR